MKISAMAGSQIHCYISSSKLKNSSHPGYPSPPSVIGCAAAAAFREVVVLVAAGWVSLA